MGSYLLSFKVIMSEFGKVGCGFAVLFFSSLFVRQSFCEPQPEYNNKPIHSIQMQLILI
jgi:hypothetical protein